MSYQVTAWRVDGKAIDITWLDSIDSLLGWVAQIPPNMKVRISLDGEQRQHSGDAESCSAGDSARTEASAQAQDAVSTNGLSSPASTATGTPQTAVLPSTEAGRDQGSRGILGGRDCVGVRLRQRTGYRSR